jgi:uncharacterized protein YggE
VQVEVTNQRDVLAAIPAALSSGATSVTALARTTPLEARPSRDALTEAVSDATSEANAMARAAAAAAGRRLGAVQSITVAPPVQQCCRPGPSGWRVEVTVVYINVQ